MKTFLSILSLLTIVLSVNASATSAIASTKIASADTNVQSADATASSAISTDHVRSAARQLGLSPEMTEKLIQTSLGDKDDEERACSAQGCQWNGSSCNWRKCGD
jgi:phage terminase small subunit